MFWAIQTPDTVWVTKKHQNVKIKLEMESMDPKLSKSGLRMFLRCLLSVPKSGGVSEGISQLKNFKKTQFFLKISILNNFFSRGAMKMLKV